MFGTQDGEETDLVVEARFQAVVSAYGDRLSPEQHVQVKARIAHARKLSAALMAIPLGNGDEPETGFAPYRADREVRR